MSGNGGPQAAKRSASCTTPSDCDTVATAQGPRAKRTGLRARRSPGPRRRGTSQPLPGVVWVSQGGYRPSVGVSRRWATIRSSVGRWRGLSAKPSGIRTVQSRGRLCGQRSDPANTGEASPRSGERGTAQGEPLPRGYQSLGCDVWVQRVTATVPRNGPGNGNEREGERRQTVGRLTDRQARLPPRKGRGESQDSRRASGHRLARDAVTRASWPPGGTRSPPMRVDRHRKV